MREHVYQRLWFKNLILLLIPTIISAIGIIFSTTTNQTYHVVLICITIILMLILLFFVIYFSNFDDNINQKLQELMDKNEDLVNILAHMENDYKTATSEISAISELTEGWSGTINAFAHNIKRREDFR